MNAPRESNRYGLPTDNSGRAALNFASCQLQPAARRDVALFFDLDGTLADTERHHWESWCAAVRPFGVEFSWARYEQIAIGHPDPEVLARLAKESPREFAGVSHQEILSEKRRGFADLVRHRTPVLKSTIDLLEQLCHFRCALVTSSSREEAHSILSGAGIGGCFETVVCLDDVQLPKPDPQPYLVAMRRLSVTSGIAFEDSAAGEASARAAGLRTVRVGAPAELPSLVKAHLSSLALE